MKKECDAVKLQSESMFSKQQRIMDNSLSERGMKVKSEGENNQELYWATREEDLKHKEAVVAQREEELRMQELRLQEAASAKASVEEKDLEVKKREDEVKARESQYQAENNKLHWMTREEDIKGKEAVLSQREDDLIMKEMRLQEATSVKASFEENEGGIKRREGEVKAREPQYQDEDTTLNELSSLKNALLEQKQEMDRRLEQR